jgi:glutathione S-transferase
MMKLLSATPSPYARKVRIALHEKNIPFELITEVPWNHGASAPTYNPLGKIPVLILEDGSTVYDSRFILEYLELKFPQTALLPQDADGIIAAKRLEVLGDGICDAIVLTFIENLRPEAHRSAEWISRQRTKIESGLAEIAKLVRPDTPYANGARFGLGDIAVGSTLGYMDLRFPDLAWRKHHHLETLFDRLSQRPSFQQTIPEAQKITDKVA